MGKANPRSVQGRPRAIWEAIFDGTVDLVASDQTAQEVNKDKPLWLASQAFPPREHAAGDAVGGLSQAEAPAAAHCQLLASVRPRSSICRRSRVRSPPRGRRFTLVDLNKERVLHAADFASYASTTCTKAGTSKAGRAAISRGVTVMDDNKVVGKGGTANTCGAASASRRFPAKRDSALRRPAICSSSPLRRDQS